VRISRSIIVNLERIKGIEAGPRGEDLVLLENGRQLLMTRSVGEIHQKLQYPFER
jgi:DNA-binding LytR/AlgR family response regulator